MICQHNRPGQTTLQPGDMHMQWHYVQLWYHWPMSKVPFCAKNILWSTPFHTAPKWIPLTISYVVLVHAASAPV